MRPLAPSGKDNFSAAVAMIALTALTLVARFGVRAGRRQAPNGADWMCLLSAALFYAYCGMIINFILNTSLYGSFNTEPQRGLVELTNLLKVTFISEILFGCVITTVKLSILWFYHIIFAVGNTAFSHVIRGAAVACTVWFVTVTFIIIFQCKPIHAYWDNWNLPPLCMNTPRLLLGYELTNLFLDVAILCIPVPIVWNLNLKSSKRMGVLSIFLLGAFVCVASIVRLTTIWNPPDVLKNFEYSAAMMWSTLQLGIAIVCACLPVLGPLLPLISKPFLSLGSWGASLLFRSGFRSGSRAYKISDQYEIPDAGKQGPAVVQGGPNGKFHGSSKSWVQGNDSGPTYAEQDVETVPPRSIMVNRDVQVA